MPCFARLDVLMVLRFALLAPLFMPFFALRAVCTVFFFTLLKKPPTLPEAILISCLSLAAIDDELWFDRHGLTNAMKSWMIRRILIRLTFILDILSKNRWGRSVDHLNYNEKKDSSSILFLPSLDVYLIFSH